MQNASLVVLWGGEELRRGLLHQVAVAVEQGHHARRDHGVQLPGVTLRNRAMADRQVCKHVAGMGGQGGVAAGGDVEQRIDALRPDPQSRCNAGILPGQSAGATARQMQEMQFILRDERTIVQGVIYQDCELFCAIV